MRDWAQAASLERSRYPSSAQILLRALSRAILRPSSASKFSGLAHALSPVTVKPLRRTSTQKVSSGNDDQGNADGYLPINAHP